MIGIPWRAKGRDKNGIDCIGLVLLVQKELFGLQLPFPFDYNPETGDEYMLLDWVPTIADKIDEIEEGALIIYRIPGVDKYHIGTVVDSALLHIYPGKTSRKTRLIMQRIHAIFRFRKEVGITCRAQSSEVY